MKQPAQSASHLQLKPLEDVSSFILAGGRSSRMGRDKAFLMLGGRTLLERAVTLAKSVCAQVRVVGQRAEFQDQPVIEDIYPGQGPLAGIHSALSQTSTDLNLVLAVDLPFIREDLLRFLISEAIRNRAVVTVPRTKNTWQPLCAVYRRDFAEVAGQALQAGQNKIGALFAQIGTRTIEQAELAAHDFRDTMFRNLNTPEEFAAAEREVSATTARG